MKAIIQRVSSASVTIKDGETREIGKGLVLLLGIGKTDTKDLIPSFVHSILNTKIFEGDDGHFTNSLMDKNFELLLVSQFTLYGELSQENTILFHNAAKPSLAKELYKIIVQSFEDFIGHRLKTGTFGAYMNVVLENDGPVTIIYSA